jgi:hypothetical protein
MAVLKNKTIKRGLAAVCKHNMWDKAQKRLLGRRSNKTNGNIVTLLPDYIAYVPNRCFDLRQKKSNTELTC